MNETSPSYVKRACENCGENIEFDESVLGPGEVLTILCPHCRADTTISRPDLFAETAQRCMSEFMGTCGQDERMDFVTLAMKGAPRGDPVSMQILGYAYYLGIALKADRRAAVKWLYRAAAAGNAEAQNSLGCLYHLGCELAKGQLQAFCWWLKAAEQGHVTAQNNVGYSSDVGEVVQRDYAEAFKWMRLAASEGFAGAKKHCDELAANMTREQREESYERVQEFRDNLAAKAAPLSSWWDQTMAEREAKLERHLAVMELAAKN
jgi:hypothetical protein